MSFACTACKEEEQLKMGEVVFRQDIETGYLYIQLTYEHDSGKVQVSIDNGKNWQDMENDIIMEFDKNTGKFTNDLGWDLNVGEEYEFSFRNKAIEKNYKTSEIIIYNIKLKEPAKFTFDYRIFDESYEYYPQEIFDKNFFNIVKKNDDGTYNLGTITFHTPDDKEIPYTYKRALIGEFMMINGKKAIRIMEFINNEFNFNENLEMKIIVSAENFKEETEWITCSEDNYLTYEIYPDKKTEIAVRVKETDTHLASMEEFAVLNENGIKYNESVLYNKLMTNWSGNPSGIWYTIEDHMEIHRYFTLGDVKKELQNASINVNIKSVLSTELYKVENTLHGYLYEFSNKDEAKTFYDYKISQNRNVKIVDERYVAEVRIYDMTNSEYPDVNCDDTSFFEALDWK